MAISFRLLTLNLTKLTKFKKFKSLHSLKTSSSRALRPHCGYKPPGKHVIIVDVYEYGDYRRPFVEVISHLGPIQTVALAWGAGAVKVRYPVVIWPDGTAQHFQIEVVPSRLCRPLRKRDLKWSEFLLDEAWHAERDRGIEPSAASDITYPQCDGRLHKAWLKFFHADRARPGADLSPLHGPTTYALIGVEQVQI